MHIVGLYTYLPLTSMLDGVDGQRHPSAALPSGMARYPLYREAGWLPGLCAYIHIHMPIHIYYKIIKKDVM